MIRKIVLAAALLLCVTANAFCLEIVDKQLGTIQGAQLFVLDAEYDGDYGRFFAELSSYGVNTLFIRIFHNTVDRTHGGITNPCPGGGVYFNTTAACVVDDILPAIIKAGHDHGIEVYGWMATRSLSFLKTPENMSLSFSDASHINYGYGANIFEPVVRSTLTRLFADLARTGVDGILIQDDFIMKYTEGADELACDKFTKDTGIECSFDSLFEQGRASDNTQIWYKWKATELQNLLKELRSVVRLIDPSIKWAANIYYETPIYPHQGLAWYAQDIQGILATGVDYLAVMMYQEQIMNELKLDINRFLDFSSDMSAKALEQVDDPARMIFKVQARKFDANRTPVDVLELKLLCNRLKRSGANSFIQLPIFSPIDILNACK